MISREIQDVQAVLMQYVDGVYRADSKQLRHILHPKARICGYLNHSFSLETPELYVRRLCTSPSMETLHIPYWGEIAELQVTGLIANSVVYERGFQGQFTLESHLHLLFHQCRWHIVAKTFCSLP